VWKYLVCDKGLRLPKSLLHVIDTVSFFNFRPAERVHGSSVAMNLDLTFSRQVSISPTFYMQLFCTKVFCTVFSANSLALYFFGKIILAQKLLAKCFWNWRQVSISQTCLRVAFTCADPKSAKRQSHHQCLFALLWSLCVKTDHKMLTKFTTDLKVWPICQCNEDLTMKCTGVTYKMRFFRFCYFWWKLHN